MSDTTSEFTIGQIARIIGERVSVIRNWFRRGLLHPSRRSGKTRWFDFSELTRARLLQRLIEQGVPARSMSAAVRRIDDSGMDAGDIIVMGTDVAVRTRDGSIVDSTGQ